MQTTLIIPGLDGSPDAHWQQWWARIDPSAIVIEQADWSHPTPEAWEAEVAGAILRHPGSILVGHSLGAVTAARILTRWPQLDVAAALLVAPAEVSKSNRTAAFGPIPEHALGVPTTVVASRDDPWMSFSQSSALARQWGGELVDLGRAGHINVDSGFGPWPGGKALRDALSRRAAAATANRLAAQRATA